MEKDIYILYNYYQVLHHSCHRPYSDRFPPSQALQKMVNDMMARNLSPKNIRDAYNNINAAMKKAVILRCVAYNPCEGVVLPKLKKYRAQVYDQKLIHQRLDMTRGTDLYLPVFLCVTVGLRRGEMLALRWDDIDFYNKLLKVRHNTVRGEKGYIIKAPKSESGLPKIRRHDLRHSNATALIQAGVNPRVVQQRLGHSDVSITLNTYTHVLPEMDAAADKIDAILLKRA